MKHVELILFFGAVYIFMEYDWFARKVKDAIFGSK
jgi:hypothetical protein